MSSVDSVVRAELLADTSLEDEEEEESMETEESDEGHSNRLTICEDQAEIHKGNPQKVTYFALFFRLIPKMTG